MLSGRYGPVQVPGRASRLIAAFDAKIRRVVWEGDGRERSGCGWQDMSLFQRLCQVIRICLHPDNHYNKSLYRADLTEPGQMKIRQDKKWGNAP